MRTDIYTSNEKDSYVQGKTEEPSIIKLIEC